MGWFSLCLSISLVTGYSPLSGQERVQFMGRVSEESLASSSLLSNMGGMSASIIEHLHLLSREMPWKEFFLEWIQELLMAIKTSMPNLA